MRIAIADLNNFSRYPTLSVGQIAAILRRAGHEVEVISPFAVGVGSYRRVTRPHALGYYESVLRHATAVSGARAVRELRRKVAAARSPARARSQAATLAEVQGALGRATDLLLISAYSMYREVCGAIAAEAARRGVPVVVGGPMFGMPEIAAHWLELPGISGVFAGEAEGHLLDLVDSVMGGGHPVPGLATPGRPELVPAAPFADFDALPFPDYADFPWDRYPNRIVPMMTGRGCGWGGCTFCSDVRTSAGRTFRSRSFPNVRDEMAWQSRRHRTGIFTFLDLKLNSDLAVWHGLIDEAQSVAPGCEWTASVHVQANGGNGLEPDVLKAARRAGLSRITTGLESAAQGVLNAMGRGTNAEALSRFVRQASEAGISVRMTSILGYPGETAEDVRLTARFLAEHRPYIDRVVVNRLAIVGDTPLGQAIRRNPARYPQIGALAQNLETGLMDHENATFRSPGHLSAAMRMLREVHRINRKPLKGASLTFEGVM
ncbi:B12-binding domain-containing radical SAM protein [Rhodovulum sp. YEN HP10]|uniref:B12-binding domain-containing radical SAM protein n=1 Tax=Rhodovulum sp. HP10 TaxID=3387397 RepID=UPI0039E115EF